MQHVSGAAFLSLFPAAKAKAQTNGGEYAGPCPLCGGRDRCLVWPDYDARGGRWTCRMCQDGRLRSDIDFILLRDHGSIPDRHDDAFKLLFWKACETLGLEQTHPRTVSLPDPEPKRCEPPSGAWQQAATAFWAYSFCHLWDGEESTGRRYLATRGITDGTAQWGNVGYNPTDLRRPGQKWGLAGETEVWLPTGLVFPHFINGILWKIIIRQDDPKSTDAKYVAIKGSSNAPLGIDTAEPKRPVVLVEGAFDWLAVCQATRADSLFSDNQRIGCVATSTNWARHMTWALHLHRCSQVLVAHDRDEAGEKAAAWWCDILGSKASRLVPTRKDCGEMLTAGEDILAWITNTTEQRKAA